MRYSSQFFMISLLVVVGLSFFQNCSQIRFEDFESNKSALDLENNGGNYGGKPSGDFYRYIPDFTCENKESPQAHIAINGSMVTLTENKTLLCGAVTQALNLSMIDFSIYQNEIIGQKEGIYTGESIAPTKIPAKLVELWCRDRKDEKGIETITYYDRNTGKAVNRIYYSSQTGDGTLEARRIEDFPVARLLDSLKVVVKDEQGFELTVYRDQPAPEAGLFAGELKAVIDGQTVERKTYCRIGGRLL